MWHTFISTAEGTVNRAMFGFANMFWQHPAVGAGLLAALLILAVMMWVEVVREPRAPMRNEDLTPLRLRL